MPELVSVKRSDLIPPPDPVRFAMDEHKLDELAGSIRTGGVWLSLICAPAFVEGNPQLAKGTFKDVKSWLKKGGKLEIVDGHRRYVAAGMVAVEDMPCNVFPDVGDAKFAMMLGANAFRQSVTAVEEGVLFIEMADKNNWDMATLVRNFGRSEDYINERACFVKDNQDLIEPVASGKLKYSHAKIIAKCKDRNWRIYLVEQAVTHGSSARTLQYMVDQWKTQGLIAEGGDPVHTPEHGTAVVLTESPKCIYCDNERDPVNMVQVPIHSYHKVDLIEVLKRLGINRPVATTGD